MSEPCDPRAPDTGADDERLRLAAAELAKKLESWAAAEGRFLNPDPEMVRDLAAGLLVNEGRYGYMVCPCREGDGRLSRDLDVICPCDYRGRDVADFDTCFCGLYVSEEAARGEATLGSIAERRADAAVVEQRAQGFSAAEAGQRSSSLAADEPSHPIWRCTTCGYLCEREAPPLHCPICLEGQDQFEPGPARVSWRD